jgi:hypothetical protein
MKQLTVTLLVGVDVPDNFDLDAHGAYDKALTAAAKDITTRSESEIKDCVEEIMDN